MKAKLLFLSLILAALPGCGRESVDFPFDQVRYDLTGGVAGFNRSMRIAEDGSYRVEEAGRSLKTGRLSRVQLAELKRLLSGVDWAGLKPRYIDGRVVDSIHQELSVRTERLEYITTVGTGGVPPEPVAALLSFLSDRLREEYP